MKIMAHSILSVILGFLGGIAATKFELRLPSHQAPGLVRAGTVRANRFELVGPSDNLLAYWTQDWQKQKILIAFVDDKGRSRAEFGTEVRLVDAGRQVVESPFTALIGSDGGIRIREGLDPSQNPVLAMGDSAGENRLLLGHWLRGDVAGNYKDPWDKWSLVFRDPSREYLDVGATTPVDTKRRTGYIVFRNSLDRQLSEVPK